ncbi:hypothetical protein C731_1609 [Mycolicibacterium hassiacum DSM 44199]|uniref:Uncharacterized protein n=1 Tax=Mycolicibacterium hassiacum (strain DSM 44199 / CIP 105218 / JCM 12690 / 3849) TaxID=1122247 RepID=K5BK81_MYCHD|nr:DUF1641 domain-containing protein [Mycolicibacterium hassiacum]EKF24404.1 hypothetical protein C731_1609 [Mycolicibacterium hassiacum DSM 44199]MBX5488412.1 DUF1641 domain-containing protein [Mycolicibacterium hassiacum]MDA4084174.1 hypothetical protein [Mycolicibacterium hassiacum DSM 44199]PZN19443.1 MAG: DUF1641 domain-containing protein [Mycolicibacterium hassiacum]VCT91184.1 hypothetical protein MHAS_02898 [Mycolicibacterium hassiacum DSM 44199]
MSADVSLITDSENELTADSPRNDLIRRLEDPKTAAALGQLLDHAELVAFLVDSIDGFVRRADVISDSVASGVAEVKQLAGSNGQRPWPAVDVAALSETVARLGAAAAAAAPVVERLLNSPLTDPQTADTLAQLGEAVVAGRQAAAADRRGPKGIFALMRATKDPDVARGLGFMIHIARAVGRSLGQDPQSARKE